MSVASESSGDSDGFSIRGLLLSGYGFLRKSLWRAIALFGVLIFLVGPIIDFFEIHGILAGMFGIWGTSVFLFGLTGYVTVKVIRKYGQYFKE